MLSKQSELFKIFSILGITPFEERVIIRSKDKDVVFAQSKRKCETFSLTRQQSQRSVEDLPKRNLMLLSQQTPNLSLENNFSWGLWENMKEIFSETEGHTE